MRSLEGGGWKSTIMVIRWLPTLLHVQFRRQVLEVTIRLSLTVPLLESR
ncbi:hypothetical protein ACLFKQ_11605 [Myxosarcina sp. GI1(2024)]